MVFNEICQNNHNGQAVGVKNKLSWIENFGCHLFDEECNPKILFQYNSDELIVVIRISNTNEKNEIRAYLCYFSTKNGRTWFCINETCSSSADGLKTLMEEEAQWKDDTTKNYWNEIFRGGNNPIDEDVLRRPEIKITSSTSGRNIWAFIQDVQQELNNAISAFTQPTTNINRVFVVGQYVSRSGLPTEAGVALPLQYALGRIFPMAKDNICGFVWENDRCKSREEVAKHFHVPGNLRYTMLNLNSEITIDDCLSNGGVTITIPMQKGEGDNFTIASEICDAQVFNGYPLRWRDILDKTSKEVFCVGELAFQRLNLSMIPNGFQKVFVKQSSSGEDKYIPIDNNRNRTNNPTRIQQPSPRGGGGGKISPDDHTSKPKLYVLDTNVYIDEPNILQMIDASYKIGISATIEDELDGKKNDLKCSKNVHKAQSSLLAAKKDRFRCVYRDISEEEMRRFYEKCRLRRNKPDHRIIALALILAEEYKVTLMTSDKGVAGRAISLGINVQTLEEFKENSNPTKHSDNSKFTKQ